MLSKNIRLHIPAILCLILLSSASVPALGCVHLEGKTHWSATLPELEGQWGDFWAVAVHDEYAYLACRGLGVAVAELGDRTEPVIVGGWPSTGDLRHILWHDGLLLVVDRDAGLVILDADDPLNLTELSTLASQTTMLSVAVHGDLLAVGEADQFRLFDIEDPESPLPMGGLAYLGWTEGMEFDSSGDILYAALGVDEGILVADVSDPFYVEELGGTPVEGEVSDLTVNGTYLLAANIPDGLQVFDLGNGPDPVLLGSYPVGDDEYEEGAEAETIVLKDGLAYLSAGSTGVTLFNVANPLSPEKIMRLPSGGRIHELAVCGDYLYEPAPGKGMDIFQLGDFSIQAPVEALGIPIRGFTLAGDSPRFYVGDAEGDVHCIHTEVMTVIGSADTVGTIFGLVNRDVYLYAANFNLGLESIDFSDPYSPVITEIKTLENPKDLAISGDYLFLLTWMNGLYNYQIVDPASPTLLMSHVGSLHSYKCLALGGNYAYLGGKSSSGEDLIEILDISNPEEIHSFGFVSSPGTLGDLTVAGDRLLGLSNSNTLLVYGLADPQAPELLSAIEGPVMNGSVEVNGSFAYIVSTRNNGLPLLWVVDIAEAEHPKPIGAMGPGFEGAAILFDGDFLWSTDFEQGLVKYPLQCENYVTGLDPVSDVSGLALRNYPNPFNPSTLIEYRLPQAAQVELKVYDVSGSLVRTLFSGRQEAGTHERVWDGLDEAGRPVASGLYFARIQGESFAGQGKLLMIK